MARRNSQASQHEREQRDGRTTTRRGKRGASVAVVRPIGRPTALTDRVEETIIGNLMDGLSIDAACALAGIHPATFHRWMQRGEDARETLDETGTLPPEEERFRDFRESVLDARAQAEQRAVLIVKSAMHGGFVTSEEPILGLDGQPVYDENGKVLYRRTMTPPDGRLALAYLQRARPKDWSIAGANLNAKVEVSGPGGGPVQVEHTVEQVMSLTERLAAVREEFEREAAEDHVLDGEVVSDTRDDEEEA